MASYNYIFCLYKFVLYRSCLYEEFTAQKTQTGFIHIYIHRHTITEVPKLCGDREPLPYPNEIIHMIVFGNKCV